MNDTIVSASARLTAGTTSAVELLEASLAAIDAGDARINAFVTVDADRARAAAHAIDAERSAGVRRGPLHGIPISLKDLIDVAGTVTTAGSRVLHDRVPTRTATVVTRLLNAGAVIIGRTNLHEFAIGTTSDSSAFGPVHHPMDTTRSAGGSSGGSAAAVAAGMGFASIGTDTGGSIRIPSAVCGLVGLKPAHGDVPVDGVVPMSVSLDHVGPIARAVQDAAWIYAVFAGHAPSTVAELRVSDLRLRILGGYFSEPLEPSVRAAFDDAVRVLAAAGVEITSATIPNTDRIGETYAHTVLPEAAHWHGAFLDTRAGDYTPSVHARISHGRTISAVQYLTARARAADFRASLDAALHDADALILPTLPLTAPLLGVETITIGTAHESIPLRPVMLRHTQLFNITGHPAITLPIAATGLPVGLQLVGHANDTRRLLDVAAACERILTQ